MKKAFVFLAAVVALGTTYFLGHSDGSAGNAPGFTKVAFAADSPPKVSPVEARPRDVYYPNSEDLAADEMRVIACGTGMPTTRAAQAAACFLVELGNGDKFIFDIGSGSAERLSSLQIPYDFLDKIFIGHLHGGEGADRDAVLLVDHGVLGSVVELLNLDLKAAEIDEAGASGKVPGVHLNHFVDRVGRTQFPGCAVGTPDSQWFVPAHQTAADKELA